MAATDYVKTLPCSIAKWIPGKFVTLGTDGFGRSDAREALRDFFEVDARYIVFGALRALLWEGKLKPEIVQQAQRELEIDPGKLNPVHN